MNEGNLVAKAQSGDKQSLETLLYDNYKIVYGYLLKLTMNEDTARDFTQETMVKAIMHIKAFSGRSKFSTWLVSIASNAYKDSLRKNRRIWHEAIDQMEMEAPEKTEDQVLLKESVAGLKKGILALPEEKRMVFVLKHYYHYSYEEIAGILKCPLGTVRSRLHYCIKKLQELL